MGIVAVASLAARRPIASDEHSVHIEPGKLARELRESIGIIFCRLSYNGDVLADNPSHEDPGRMPGSVARSRENLGAHRREGFCRLAVRSLRRSMRGRVQ
jgi:hypothetical protein